MQLQGTSYVLKLLQKEADRQGETLVRFSLRMPSPIGHPSTQPTSSQNQPNAQPCEQSATSVKDSFFSIVRQLVVSMFQSYLDFKQ